MNTLSIVASFGALVWIFQDGNLSALLGFQPLGFVETTQPVILFCVLFGLSMDYEVFLLSRMKEVWDRTGDNTEAVARGLERSGRIVTSAALIVVVVAGSFAFADIVLIKALGIGMAIAVALDATVVRALLVPATMRLLGQWNWWMPAALERSWRTGCPPPRPTSRRRSMTPVAARRALVAGRRPRDRRVVVAGCAAAARSSPTRPAPGPSSPSPAPTPAAVADPLPVVLPRDDGPHDRLTEWWYYTGHLRTADGRRFGFEYVIFRAERGAFPTSWASHLAITDETGDRFVYAQRLEVGPAVDRSPRGPDGEPTGFDLSLTGLDPSNPATAGRPAWTMAGARRARTGSRRWRRRDEAARPARRRVRPRPDAAPRPSRRPSTTTTAGSTSGRPAARTTTRGPR